MHSACLLFADDHTLFRQDLQALFASLPDIQLLCIPGPEASRQIIDTSPHIGVIIVTKFEVMMRFLLQCGSRREYLLKGADQEGMSRTISEKTLRSHGPTILSKLQAADRIHTTIRASEAGLDTHTKDEQFYE